MGNCLFIRVHHLVQQSSEEHDLLHLIACGLFGTVKMNHVEVLSSKFYCENVVVKVCQFVHLLIQFGCEMALPLLSPLLKDKKPIIKPVGLGY